MMRDAEMKEMTKRSELEPQKVLWYSRHQMTDSQMEDLKRIFKVHGKEPIIKQVSESASSWKDVLAAGEDCDVLAVVLPPSMLADLTNPRNNRKPVIRAVAKRVPTGNKVLNPATQQEEDEFMFQHEFWEKVEKIEVVTTRL